MSRIARSYFARPRVAIAAACLMVTGCTGPGQTPALPPGPVAAIAELAQVKLLSFEWTGGDGATSYRVSRLFDSQPTIVVDDVPGTEPGYDLELFLPDQLAAEYQVEACNAAGCTASQIIEVERAELDIAIGYVKAPDPTDEDRLGTAVAVSADGRVLAVGAPREDGGGGGVNPPVDESLGNSGAVYLFERTAAGQWSGPTYLKAPVPGANDQFGIAVALSADGTALAVGANWEAGSGSGINPPHDDNAASAGAVYVYEKSEAGLWGEPIYFKAGQVDGGDGFGSSVALSADGNTLVVGGPDEDGSGIGVNPPVDELYTSAGAAWIFERSEAGIWQQTAYVKARNPDSGDRFGYSVALSGDARLLAVGGPAEDGTGAGVGATADDAGTDVGAVWVYAKDDTGQWLFDEYLKASNSGNTDGFGLAVSLTADGSLLAVGAPYEDGSGIHVDPTPNDSAMDTGAVYVFERGPEGAWSGPVYVKPDGPSESSLFGYGLAWSGDGTRLAIGTPAESAGGTGIQPPPGAGSLSSGAVWLYERFADGEWSDGRRVKASNTGAGDFYGIGIALSHDANLLAVGSQGEDGGVGGIGGNQNDNSAPNSGAVYLY